jgi:putative hydrolase of the HAD superfamily
MPQYPPAILFDLDDTLISFEGVAEQAWEICCKKLVVSHLLEIPASSLLKQVNETRKWYWGDPERHRRERLDMLSARREMVKTAMQALNIRNISLSNELADDYSTYRKDLISVFPSTVPTLKTLRNAGVRLGLITNGTGEEQRGKINRFGLAEYFELIFIEGEVGFGKPDIRIYEKALSTLNLPPHEVWMVGDNLVWDIEAPQSLGIHSVWNDYKHEGLPIDSKIIPDRIINDVSELIDADK